MLSEHFLVKLHSRGSRQLLAGSNLQPLVQSLAEPHPALTTGARGVKALASVLPDSIHLLEALYCFIDVQAVYAMAKQEKYVTSKDGVRFPDFDIYCDMTLISTLILGLIDHHNDNQQV